MDSFRDNLPRHRRRYAALRTKKARTRFLGHLTATLGINRKYLIKLLGGKRAYKPHRGRGRSYSEGACGLLAAATQWFECAPSWNRSAEATARAMKSIHARLPFGINHAHPDNGSEFINRLFLQALAELCPGVQVSRSRPYHKNDNCRTGQKNGSVIREYFGDVRLDRLADFLPADDPRLLGYQRKRDTLNSITLYKSIQGQLHRLVREPGSPPRDGMPSRGGESPARPSPGHPVSVSTHLTDALPNKTIFRCPSLLT